MTLEQLTEIIKLADQKEISKRLCELSYIDCKKHKRYKNISLEAIFNGNLEETDEFPDTKGKHTYQGAIFRKVVGYEQLEFVMVNINDNKNTFPIDLLIYAKENKLI